MSPPINIRPAKIGDRDALLPLFQELNRHHAALQPGYFREVGGLPPALQLLEQGDEAQGLLVAEREGELVGYLVARVHDTPEDPLLVRRRRAHVEDMMVAATARRQGVGRALVEAAARLSRERGAKCVLLTVWQGNEGAEAFYRSIGFEPLSCVLELPLREDA